MSTYRAIGAVTAGRPGRGRHGTQTSGISAGFGAGRATTRQTSSDPTAAWPSRTERRIESLHDRLEAGEVDVIADAATQSAIVGGQRRPRGLHCGGGRSDAVWRQHRTSRGRARSGQRRRHRVEHRIGAPATMPAGRRLRSRSPTRRPDGGYLRTAPRRDVPNAAARPGLPPSTTMSASAANSRNRCRSCASSGSSTALACSRCPARTGRSPRPRGRGWHRPALPPGGSIFRTSAPRSARCRVDRVGVAVTQIQHPQLGQQHASQVSSRRSAVRSQWRSACAGQ